MRPDAVAVVREAVKVFNRHNWAAFEQLLHPKISAVDHQAPIGVASELVGSAQYVKARRTWTEMFDGARVEVDEYIQMEDQVICSARYCGAGRLSGAKTELRQFDVYRVADGAIVEAEVGFKTLDEALAAAGPR